jgi:Protein of unknown function (DUF3300)
MKTIFRIILLMLGLAALTACAQDEVPPPTPNYQSLSDPQLQQLLGPIALYPDPLIGVMLPAATLPTQIVIVDRYISNGGDPSQLDQDQYDPNVIALAHYPDVLKWMDDNLNWTTQLGQTFLNQQPDIISAIQELRTTAYNLGNLQSTPQMQVIDDNGYIEILPANPDNLYVPEYQPNQVYDQPPSGPPYISFSVGYIVGPWLCSDFDWHRHHLVYWNSNFPRPVNWWKITPAQRTAYYTRYTTTWNSANRPASAGGYHGDRGYQNNSVNWSVPVAIGPAPTLGGHPEPVLGEHPEPVLGDHPESTFGDHPEPVLGGHDEAPNNAFIGIQSAQQTRSYSNRGQQSMQTMPQGGAPAGAAWGGGGGGRR